MNCTMKRALLASLRRSPAAPCLLSKRYVSAFGYTQAKALVYSRYGQPKDVLRYPTTIITTTHYPPSEKKIYIYIYR